MSVWRSSYRKPVPAFLFKTPSGSYTLCFITRRYCKFQAALEEGKAKGGTSPGKDVGSGRCLCWCQKCPWASVEGESQGIGGVWQNSEALWRCKRPMGPGTCSFAHLPAFCLRFCRPGPSASCGFSSSSSQSLERRGIAEERLIHKLM